MLTKPRDGKFMAQIPKANQRFVGSDVGALAGALVGDLSGVQKVLYEPKHFGCRIWEPHDMLQSLFCDIIFEMLTVELGAIAEEVFLDAKRLLIGTN